MFGTSSEVNLMSVDQWLIILLQGKRQAKESPMKVRLIFRIRMIARARREGAILAMLGDF